MSTSALAPLHQGWPHQLTAEVRAQSNLSSALISSFLIFIASCFAIALSDQFWHWFIIPISACGMIIGTDAVDWVLGRCDLYDPVGILGLFGVHFFYTAPLLHVNWNIFINDVPAPPDWRNWLGAMAILNCAGLITYNVCRRARVIQLSGRNRTFWKIDQRRMRLVGLPLLAIAVVAQMVVYRRFGGIGGFVDARLSDAASFEGLGWLFLIAESVPILAAFLLINHSFGRRVTWPAILSALLLMFSVQMLFGGLRGSRSQTINSLIWITGCVHLLIRPVPRKLVCAGLLFLIGFMYLYGFYKELGTDAVRAISGAEERAQLSARSGRTLQSSLVGDLGRSDIQAFTLYRLWADGREFSLAWGRTYLGAVSVLIPHRLLPSRPETVLKEGTDIQSGAGTYVPRTWSSTRVYGFGGEAMLNFGPAIVPAAYGVFGLVIGLFRNFIQRLPAGDARLLLVPFGVYLCITLLAGDSDNITYAVVKDGFTPALVVLLGSIRYSTDRV